MKKLFLSPVGLVIVHIAAAAVNFAYYVSAHSDIKWLYFAVTLLYIWYWCVFIAKGRHTKIGTAFFSVLFAVSVTGLVIAKYSLLADWFIPAAVLLVTPFAGLGAVFRSWHCWAAVAVISAIMSVFSGVIAVRRRTDMKMDR